MRALIVALLALLSAEALPAQSYLERTPGLAGTWTLERGEGFFAFTHRFELLNGGDELINFPTMTLAAGLPLGLTAGLDYTSNSEVVRGKEGDNETQYWLKRALPAGGPLSLSGLVGYNTAAESVDAALGARGAFGRVALLGELRGFSRRFGEDEPGVAGAVGAVVRLTPFLGLSGDVARGLYTDAPPAAWSAGVAVGIPGSPHTLSLHATNSGALTLHGASREKAIGVEDLRWGFIFTAPLGSGSRWARIFRPAPPPPPTVAALATDSIAAVVDMRQNAYTPRVVRIRAGQSVQWINSDPVPHTVTADDGTWGSGFMTEGERFVQRFDTPGEHSYYCLPHPDMKGVVVVEP